jgi:hypothetical protein
MFEISYKQLVTTDQCNLVTVVEHYVDLLANLPQKLHILNKALYGISSNKFSEDQDGTVKS